MDKILLNRAEKHGWVRRYPRAGPLVLFVLAALATLVAVVALERADRLRHRMALENYATEAAASIQTRAMQQISALHAASAVFAVHNPVSRDEFAFFASRISASEAFERPLLVGWAQRVPTSEIARFEQVLRAEGAKEFRIFPRPRPGRRAVYPILFVDPWTDSGHRYVGYDLYSDPLLREAMDRSARIAEPVATRRLQIIERSANGTISGLVIVMPVFEQSEVQRILKGFAYSTIEAGALVAPVAAYSGANKRLRLYDQIKSPATLLASRGPSEATGPTIDRELRLANRTWILSVSTAQETALSDLAWATMVFGLVLSLLLAVIARLITHRAAEDRVLLDWYTRQAAIRTSLSRELSHRVKNTLANVLSIVALTRRRATGVDDFADNLIGRLRALSATQDLLSQSDWREASIGELLRAELAPYIEEEEEGDPKVTLEGPEISLAPNDALSLGLAVHELATNAAKYGALTVGNGKVSVRWHLETPDVALVIWIEEGGPPVTPPSRRGFGIDLIEKIVSQELNSKVELQFSPDGVQCRLRVPVRRRGDFVLRSQTG